MATREKGGDEELNKLLGNLKILGSTSSSSDGQHVGGVNKVFEEALKGTDFAIFTCIADLGYYAWKPTPSSSSSSSSRSTIPVYGKISRATATEIRNQIDLHGKPDKLVVKDDDIRSSSLNLPKAFENYLDPQEFKNQYPYGGFSAVGLYVAVQDRGLALEQIDFMFGGSTLEMLANKGSNNNNNQYVAVQVPHSKIIVVQKYKKYVQNYADIGFQFERLMTGKRMADKHSVEKVEHLQVMKVGGQHNVLFGCEADAVTQHGGETVEIKASNPRYWGSKVMFQMISSGSTKLCHGTKGRGGSVLQSVRLMSLAQVAQNASHMSVPTLEKNILDGMAALQSQMSSHPKGTVLNIVYRGGKLTLEPAPKGVDILPSEKVLKELLLAT